jgi:hypothetical protein
VRRVPFARFSGRWQKAEAQFPVQSTEKVSLCRLVQLLNRLSIPLQHYRQPNWPDNISRIGGITAELDFNTVAYAVPVSVPGQRVSAVGVYLFAVQEPIAISVWVEGIGGEDLRRRCESCS